MRNLENKYPNNLRELRVKKNLTLKQVATLLSLESENRVCRWERGQSQPGLSNLMKLIRLYQVPVESIYQNL